MNVRMVYCFQKQKSVEGKCGPVRTKKAYRGSGGIDPDIPNNEIALRGIRDHFTPGLISRN